MKDDDEYRSRSRDLVKKIKKLKEQVACQDGRKAPRCEYRSLGQQCTFAGTISPQISGEGNWYCRFHYSQLQGHLTEAEAAEKVRERFTKPKERDWHDEIVDAKIEEMKDDPLMQMAQTIAKGECSRQDKADFLGLMIGELKGAMDLPYEKSDRDPGVRNENIYEDDYR